MNPVSTDSGRVLRWGFLAAAAGVSGGVGRGSRQKGLLTAFKMLDMAQRRWRRVNSAELVLLVRAGVTFIDGLLAERVAVGKDAAGLIPTRVIGDPLSRFTRIAREHQLDLPRPAG